MVQRRTAICYFLATWFEDQISDFEFGPIMAIVQNWIKAIPAEYMNFLSCTLEQKLRSRQFLKKYYLFGGNELENELQDEERGKKLVEEEFSFLNFSAEDVAVQYSLLDMESFIQMRPDEFWDFHPENNCQKIIQRGVKFSQWIASEIVSEPLLEKRVEIMSRFVQIGQCMLEYDNFNGLMWVWLGLQSRAVDRLTLTKEKLPEKIIEIMNTLAGICGDPKYGPLKNAAATQLKQNKVVIPWFKLLDRAVTNIEVSYNDVVLHPQGGLPLLNFEKMWVYGEQIRYFYEFYEMTHTIACKKSFTSSVLALREYLLNIPIVSEAELITSSLTSEPVV